jgi:type VI secretion system VasI family protein
MVLIAALPAISYSDISQTSEEMMRECDQISDSLEKSQCMADVIKVLSATLDPESMLSWRTTRETDPMTDRQAVIVFKGSVEGRDRNGLPYMLSIRCENKKTKMAFHWNTYIGRESARLQLRVDKGKPNTTIWTLSEGGQTMFWPKHRHIPGMVKRWFEADRIVVRTTAYGQGDLTAVFDVSDLEDGVVPVRKACGW